MDDLIKGKGFLGLLALLYNLKCVFIELKGIISCSTKYSHFLRHCLHCLHHSPVSREPVGLGAPYFLCLLYITGPTDPVISTAWTCIA